MYVLVYIMMCALLLSFVWYLRDPTLLDFIRYEDPVTLMNVSDTF